MFDTTGVDAKSSLACLNWPSAQAVTLSESHMRMAKDSNHQGVVFNGTLGGGGGSATYMGDLVCLNNHLNSRYKANDFSRVLVVAL